MDFRDIDMFQHFSEQHRVLALSKRIRRLGLMPPTCAACSLFTERLLSCRSRKQHLTARVIPGHAVFHGDEDRGGSIPGLRFVS